jgi:protein-disulfide isomerase
MRTWWKVAALLVVGMVVGVLVGRSGLSRPVASMPSLKAPVAAAPAPERPLPSDPARVVYRIPLDGSPVRGPADALVTIVEASDFQCPFCKRVLPTLTEVEKTYSGKVRFVFKHNPLSFHDKARLAASAAEQARVQGGDKKFWEMHDLLFELSPNLDRRALEQAAGKLGLDAAAFGAGLDSGKNDVRIDRDQSLVTALGATGTPTFFVNGRLLVGAVPFESFKSVIDEELARADALVRTGTPAVAVYDKLIENGATRALAPPAPPAPAGPSPAHVRVRADDPVRGPRAAKVTIVLFSDFQCPFCARVEPTLKTVLEKYGKNVRLVWKHNPLPMHPAALPAAIAAEAAHQQGKFWEMHDAMFGDQQNLSPAHYDLWARDRRLDMARFRAAVESRSGLGRIEEDQKLAASVGVNGTPTMFINCRPLVGAQPFEQFRTLIDEEIQKANTLIAAGTKLDAGFHDRICDQNVPATVAGKQATPAVEVSTRPDDPVKGSDRAAVTIVAFSDFECPFCARVEPTLQEVLRTYGEKVRLVWKHQPLSFHANAFPAAMAAEAARQQGKFWQMHDLLLAHQSELGPEAYERWAKELGLDLETFRASSASQAVRTRIQEDQALGWKIGASGTPTFFVNGERVVGAVSTEQLKAVIDRQLGRSARR